MARRGLAEWAWGGSNGRGIRVCILDSGVEPSHPAVGSLTDAVAVVRGPDGEITIEQDEAGDLCGHGTACAGIVRSLAPECELFSVRVLGAGYSGSGEILVAGLRYAIENAFDVVNMSLSTTKRELAESLHELADLAYFQKTMLVASAHNLPVESYPWRFASVCLSGATIGLGRSISITTPSRRSSSSHAGWTSTSPGCKAPPFAAPATVLRRRT
jgi:subtilisin family serine protease